MSNSRRKRLVAWLIFVVASCVGSRAYAQTNTSPERLYVLTAINDRPLPYRDTTAAFISPLAVWTNVRGSLRISAQKARLYVTKHFHFYDTWPCDALRASREDQRRGKSGGYASTAVPTGAAGDSTSPQCDDLREETDSSRFIVLRPAPGIEVLVDAMKQDFAKWPFPETGTVVSDTVRLTHWTVSGENTRTGSERAQELRFLFVRAESAPPR